MKFLVIYIDGTESRYLTLKEIEQEFVGLIPPGISTIIPCYETFYEKSEKRNVRLAYIDGEVSNILTLKELDHILRGGLPLGVVGIIPCHDKFWLGMEEVEERLKEIDEFETKDNERAHSEEDKLYRDFLRHVSIWEEGKIREMALLILNHHKRDTRHCA